MKLFFFAKIAAVTCIAAIATGQAFGCQCSGGFYYGKSSWEVAKLEADGSGVIFEGTPERFELQWDVLNGKTGELIPAENGVAKRDHGPGMLVTFRVQRAYKGTWGRKSKLKLDWEEEIVERYSILG